MENIKISNFRKIQDTWDLDLAPITFFTGTNNSGKSTILKALLILEDHLNSNNHFELDFNGDNANKHKIDCYTNAVNRHNETQNNKDLSFQYSNRGYKVKFHFQPSEDKTNGKGKLIRLEVEREDNSKLIIYHIGGLNYQLEFDDTLMERRKEPKDDKSRLEDLVLVRTIENLLVSDKEMLSNLEADVQQLENKISELKIKSVEKTTKETIEPKNQKVTDVNSTIRLGHVLRELNISLDRAVDFLNSKQIDIERKINTKIDEKTYNLLAEEFALDAVKKTFVNSLEGKAARLEKELKGKKQQIISLNQEIIDSKKKLRIANKKLKESTPVESPIITYKPEFSLEDFHPSERTIDRVIRKVLPNYLREYDESSKLAGVGNAVSRAFRLGDKINSAIFFSVDHLSPHRNNQTRLYINNNTTTDINELIKENSNSPILKKNKTGVFFKKWMKTFDIGDDYRMKSIDGVATKIEVLEGNTWVNLVDKGFGAGQIFSVLFKIALCIENTKKDSRFRFSIQRKQIVVIEEPEANLHPALQAKLADLFYGANKEFGIRFILETHSEYILRKSQIHVKKLVENGIDLKNIPFAVYYFDKESGPYKMNYREDGIFKDDFGTGFFDVASRDSIELLKRKHTNG